jgi:hypothetical protein
VRYPASQRTAQAITFFQLNKSLELPAASACRAFSNCQVWGIVLVYTLYIHMSIKY